MAEIVTSITDQIDLLIQYKTDIAKAINRKNSSAGLTADSPLSEFAEKIDAIAGGDVNLTELNATSNGTFTPEGDYVGYSRVTVNVSSGSSGGGSSDPGGGGANDGEYDQDELPEYTVTFKSEADDEWSYEETVKYGNNAQGPASADIPDKEGYKFLSWQPAPNNITADLTTNAKYKSLSASLDDVSWAEIAESGGSIAQIGDYKTLRLGKIPIYPITINTYNYNQPYPGSIRYFRINKTIMATANIQMMKVADNEEGASSTWMACGYLEYTPVNGSPTMVKIPYHLPGNITSLLNEGNDPIDYYYNGITSPDSPNSVFVSDPENSVWDTDGIWWSNSFARKYLNDIILPAIDESVGSHIKRVTKYSTGQTRKGAAFSTDLTTSDKLWLFSNTELFGSSADYGSKAVYYDDLAFKKFPTQNNFFTRDIQENQYVRAFSAKGIAISAQQWGVTPQGIYFGFCL